MPVKKLEKANGNVRKKTGNAETQGQASETVTQE